MELERALKTKLDRLQSVLTKNVAQVAVKAWKTRLQNLNDEFKGENLQADGKIPLVEALEKDISKRLDDISVIPMDETVRSLIVARVGDKGQKISQIIDRGLAFWARSKAEKEIFKDEKKDDSYTENFMRRFLKLKTSDSMSPATPEGTSIGGIILDNEQSTALEDGAETELGAEALNFVGFLMRAPVLATAVGDAATVEIWPFLKSSSKNERVTLTLIDVTSKYKDLVVSTWFDIISKECRNSLMGAIELSSGYGMQTVLKAIDAKLDQLQEKRTLAEKPLPHEALEHTIISYINCVTASAATDAIRATSEAER